MQVLLSHGWFPDIVNWSLAAFSERVDRVEHYYTLQCHIILQKNQPKSSIGIDTKSKISSDSAISVNQTS